MRYGYTKDSTTGYGQVDRRMWAVLSTLPRSTVAPAPFSQLSVLSWQYAYSTVINLDANELFGTQTACPFSAIFACSKHVLACGVY